MKNYHFNSKHLSIEIKDNSIAFLTLNNPKSHNAISMDMIEGIESLLPQLDMDVNIRVIILTGSGKSFCAGGDIKAMNEDSGMFSGESNELRRNYIEGIQRIPRAIEHFSKPIIAMVNGAAIGAGCDLACMCDLRVASDTAVFAETFSKLSLVPGDGGTFFLQRVVGYSKAMEMFLTGKKYSAKDCQEFGLVNEICDTSLLETKCMELAELISSNAPISISLTKQALKAAYRDHLHPHLQTLAAYQGIAQRTSDHREGVKSLLEKRGPDFKGF